MSDHIPNMDVDQDQLNPYVAYEGYVVRIPHNPLTNLSEFDLLLTKVRGLVSERKPVT